VKAWIKVVALGLAKIPAKILAPIMVLFVDRKKHYVWGVRDAADLSWWNTGVRNGAHNMFSRPAVKYVDVATNTEDHTLEKEEGIQWRLREDMSGEYVSFRITWGKPRRKKGKKEFYIGWTMNEQPTMRLTFFQLRPVWPLLVVIALAVLLKMG
jgi:hypothetical protein